MTVIAIPRILQERLTAEGAEALVQILDKVEEQAKDRTIEVVEDKFERRLAEEIGKLRVEMHSLRADIIRWMFLFWVGQAATTVGILFVFFKK